MSHVKHAKPDHPVLEPIAQRWSPYAYEPRPVERQKLMQCLEAARWAASSYNEQPWSLIVAERSDTAAFNKMLSVLVPGNQEWARNAGVLILTVVKRHFSRNNSPNRVCEHDIGLMAGNLVLQATALGLAAHQMAGVELSKARQVYQIPEGHDPLTAIALGYPAGPGSSVDLKLAERDATPRARKPLREFVFGDRFGATSPII